jgi:hypothetical protein
MSKKYVSPTGSTYIYQRDQRDKVFHPYAIEDKMNKELRLELETQGNLLDTMQDEMEAFNGGKLPLEEENNHSIWFAFTVACQDSTKETRSSFSGKTSLRMRPSKAQQGAKLD